jgi:hypothetical protein
MNDLNDEEVKNLNNDIRMTTGYESIFLIGDSKKQLRSNHQKGHVSKDGIYIKHTEVKGKRRNQRPQQNRERVPRQQRPNNNDPNQPQRRNPIQTNFDFSKYRFSAGGNMPKYPQMPAQGGFRPNIPPVGSSQPLPIGMPAMRPPMPNNSFLPPNIGGQPPQPNFAGFKPQFPTVPQFPPAPQFGQPSQFVQPNFNQPPPFNQPPNPLQPPNIASNIPRPLNPPMNNFVPPPTFMQPPALNQPKPLPPKQP